MVVTDESRRDEEGRGDKREDERAGQNFGRTGAPESAGQSAE
jgi:hypothetical protein